MKYLAAILIMLFFLEGCSEGEDSLYRVSDSIDVSVAAWMVRSLDSSSMKMKADTVLLNDSLVFMAEVAPAKSIRLQKYFWTLDNREFSTEFTTRKSVARAGFHELCFFLIDYFGDTLSDTLQLWVGRPPVLDTRNFVPASKSQGIPASEDAYFAWSAYDPDSIYELSYRFVLMDETDTIADARTTKPYFIQHGLKPLKKYKWNVSALNELGMASDSVLTGIFYTKGVGEESGGVGFVWNENARNSLADEIELKLILMTKENEVLDWKKIKGNTKDSIAYSIGPVTSGEFRMTALAPDFPDYRGDTVKVQFVGGQVTEIPTILFRDSIAPTLKLKANGTSDTLDFADSLQFVVNDGGGLLSEERVSASLETSRLLSRLYQDSLFTVYLPETAKSWNFRLLNITATDRCGNTTYRTYYIKPSVSLDSVGILGGGGSDE